jgi:hypothetical protein
MQSVSVGYVSRDRIWGLSETKGTAEKIKLPPLALDVIQTQPQIAGNPYAFAGRGKTAFNSFSQRSIASRNARKSSTKSCLWPMTFEVAKRAVGVIILLLAVVLLPTPVPLSNVAPATVISLISVAYLEEYGLLLSAAFLAAIILIGIGSAAVWGTIVRALLTIA